MNKLVKTLVLAGTLTAMCAGAQAGTKEKSIIETLNEAKAEYSELVKGFNINELVPIVVGKLDHIPNKEKSLSTILEDDIPVYMTMKKEGDKKIKMHFQSMIGNESLDVYAVDEGTLGNFDSNDKITGTYGGYSFTWKPVNEDHTSNYSADILFKFAYLVMADSLLSEKEKKKDMDAFRKMINCTSVVISLHGKK